MPYTVKTDHELGWGDREMRYLITAKLTDVNIYRAMGYKGKAVSASFKRRLEQMRQGMKEG